MKIGFVSADWGHNSDGSYEIGGCQYVRLRLPGDQLASQAGWDVVYGTDLAVHKRSGEIVPRLPDGSFDDGCDVIVLQRWMHQDAEATIRAARKNGQVVLNDIDDLFLQLPPSNAAFHATDPRTKPESNRRHYLRAIRASSGLIVSTPYLAQRYRSAGVRGPIFTIRNCVDLQRDWWDASERDNAEQLIVGWVGSTSHRGNDLEQLQGSLGKFLDEVDGLFYHGGWNPDAGARPAGQLAGVDPTRCITRPPIPVLQNTQLYRGFDISLVPLNRIPFNQAKSALKGMESACAGIPFIASSSLEYQWFGSGVVVDNIAEEWLRALRRLADVGERQRLRAQQRAVIEQHDIRLHWGKWQEAIVAVAGSVKV
jgi:hypothetical protein